MPTVLTIAGFDPSSGAGATADLMVFAAHGIFGTSCLTSLTVQSTVGVVSSQPISAGLVADSLQCLEDDLPPAGIKLGMLAAAPIVEAVVEYLAQVRLSRPGVTVVLDPVLQSSSGKALLDDAGVELLKSRLLPLVDWVTPNLAELAVLTQMPEATRETMAAQARILQAMGSPGLHVLAKGGHLRQAEALSTPDDLLLTAARQELWLPGEWVETSSTHGTGCALSSALLSRLVLGDSAAEAARRAKHYVAQAMRTATPVGRGRGPMNLLWPLLP